MGTECPRQREQPYRGCGAGGRAQRPMWLTGAQDREGQSSTSDGDGGSRLSTCCPESLQPPPFPSLHSPPPHMPFTVPFNSHFTSLSFPSPVLSNLRGRKNWLWARVCITTFTSSRSRSDVSGNLCFCLSMDQWRERGPHRAERRRQRGTQKTRLLPEIQQCHKEAPTGPLSPVF